MDNADRRAGPDAGAGACVLLFGFLYGIAMGSYGGVGGDRVWQLLYSGLKVPLLLLATFFIGLPSFFVLNTLFGLRRDFREALRALVAAQAGVAIVLASCAPLTLFWYASFADYSAALLFNGLIFAVASFAGQFLLRGYYRPLTGAMRVTDLCSGRGWGSTYSLPFKWPGSCGPSSAPERPGGILPHGRLGECLRGCGAIGFRCAMAVSRIGLPRDSTSILLPPSPCACREADGPPRQARRRWRVRARRSAPDHCRKC